MLVWKLSLPSQAAVHPHRIFLIGMRPSDRITLFIRNASTLPFDVRALNMLSAIGQSSAPMTKVALWSGFSPRCCRAITNNTDNKCVHRRQRNSLCDFTPVFAKDRQPCCGKRIRGEVYSASAAGEEAQAPECQQIMASSPKPTRGEPEFRSTTDCRRPLDIVASPSRGRPSNRPS